jgi:tetratricopeptide (TPR) repeat protein
MKNTIITILLLVSICAISMAQSVEELLKQNSELIEQKKYATAFNALNQFDPKNGKPDVLVAKVDIALKYHINTIMHQFFSFTDIKPDEDILQYRDAGGNYELKMFSIQSALDSLMRVYPENAKLNKSAGLFYFEVLINYGDNWLKEPRELVQLAEGNLSRAHLMDLADHETYYALGYMKLISNRIEQSIPEFLKSIDIKEDFAASHYNLAYALQSINKNNDALSYARNAFNLYKNAEQKSDAARMIGAIYQKAGEKATAKQYYEQAYQLNPNYYNIRAVLDIYLNEGNKKSQQLQTEFFNLAPENPAIYNDLIALYGRYNQTDNLIKFFEGQLKKIKDEPIVSGNLNLYLSLLYKESNKEKSKSHLLAARKIFEEVLEAENPIFEAIDKALTEY